MTLLEVVELTKRFGGIIAVNNVSFKIEKGEIVGLIGPNGSGKTTLVNLISGYYKPDGRRIIFEERDITNLPPEKRAKLGISRTFQNPRVVESMTALLNVAYAILGTRGEKMSLAEAGAEAMYYLEIFDLLKKRDTLAKDLAIYELRLLELARALATEPKLLMIDEAMAGLNPAEADNVVRVIERIREEFDLTIIWIEHVLRVLMRSVERVLVMDEGRLIADGPPEEVTNKPEVIEAYIGAEEEV